ncbi:MAG: LOG family protein, partial [Clostridia bacterium]|nr:LOG family protein [Clostridia bacterium]
GINSGIYQNDISGLIQVHRIEVAGVVELERNHVANAVERADLGFEVLTLKQLGRHNKPIIIYNIDNYYEHLEEMMAQSMADKFINENCHALYEITEDPDRLLAYLEKPDQPQLSVHQLKDG